MDSTIIAYLAGIIDGEGSINITQYKTRSRHIRWRPSIKLCMVDRESVELFSQTFGFNVYIGKTKTGRSVYSCEAAWRGCKKILETLYPYLRVKKELAKIVIDFCNHVSEYGLNPTDRPAFRRDDRGRILKGAEYNTLSVEEAEYRQNVYLQVKSFIYGKSNTIHRQRLSEEAVEDVRNLWKQQSELKENESSEISRND